jgi:hypothetical protein
MTLHVPKVVFVYVLQLTIYSLHHSVLIKDRILMPSDVSKDKSL